MSNQADFFLDAIDKDGPEFRGAAQAGCEVIPLIDRVPAFQAMERAVLAAKRSVHLSGWLFIAETPLQDASVSAAIGGSTWLDLIAFICDRADAPVQVRVVVTDFDPLFDVELHRLSWRAIAALASARSKLSASNATNLQFFPSRHEAMLGAVMLKLAGLTSMLTDALARQLRAYNKAPFKSAVALYRRTPGHWSSIMLDPRKRRFVLSAHPRDVLHFGSHHQKLCIVDSQIAFCGGMDVTDVALNDRRHRLKRAHRDRKRPDLLWHDIHCELHGPAVFEIERNFVERWQREAQLFANRVPEFAAHLPHGAKLPQFFFEIKLDQTQPRPRLIGPSMAQIHRTLSVGAKSALAPPPANLFQTVRSDVLEGYQRAIEQAQRYVYFENQYFRSRQIAEALIARRSQNPRLQVIVVLPVAPEEFDETLLDDPLVAQPIALQNEIIAALRAAFGTDIGFFSLVAPIASARSSITDEAGSPQIYVHSKVCVVDDVFASIGSANANGRGFLLDTELNIAWLDPAMKVGEFRIDLWSELLGVGAHDIAGWEAHTFTSRWRAIATRNAAIAPTARSAFVVEHDESKFADLIGPFVLPKPLEALLSIVDLSHQRAPVEADSDESLREPAVS